MSDTPTLTRRTALGALVGLPLLAALPVSAAAEDVEEQPILMDGLSVQTNADHRRMKDAIAAAYPGLMLETHRAEVFSDHVVMHVFELDSEGKRWARHVHCPDCNCDAEAHVATRPVTIPRSGW
jgi:hypothetical protein